MRDEDQRILRLIAFYLPQFHPIPENDAWWGPGFTEWRNVVQARPLFPGHYQPHLPADLGFYDLRVPEVRAAQAEMAEAYGVSAFCYYHYWFNGRRLLNRPFDEVLRTGAPRFNFCLCWANESWTRRWDGMSGEVLLQQQYSAEDDRAHIDHLIPAFADDRYIKIGGRPVFLVYRSHLLPHPMQTADLWRERARAAGFDDLYLIRVAGYGREIDPQSIGFDAVVEFAPDWTILPPHLHRTEKWGLRARINNQLQKLGVMSKAYRNHNVFSYDALAARMRSRPKVPFKRFRCVTPGWDNSPRRRKDALIFRDATPESYEVWMRNVAQETLTSFEGDERILFVNAWNEWAEGNHLEPDQRWGRAYLEATARAVADAYKQTAQS